MKKKCLWCGNQKDAYFGEEYGTEGMNRLSEEANRRSKKRKTRFLCDDCNAGYDDWDEDKYWIHREQKGKIRGVQRLGFKRVSKRRSFW